MTDPKRYIRGTLHGEQGEMIQSLPPSLTKHTNINFTGTSARYDITGWEVLRLAANEACYIKFGGSSVTATANDIYFPAGVEVLVVPSTATYIAVIQSSGSGILSVTAMGDI